MPSPEDFDYAGPPREYVPSTGDYREDPSSGKLHDPSDSMADLDYLDRLLTQVINANKLLIKDVEEELAYLILPITDEPQDSRLSEAHLAEWPNELGNPKRHISYHYYKALRNRNSNSASYIRKRYVQAVRDVGGHNGVDIVPLAEASLDEAYRVKGFIERYVGSLGESSDHRTVELLQEWAETALAHTGELRSLFEKRSAPKGLPDSEIKSITPAKAKSSQAIFKDKINELNAVLDEQLQELKKTFSDYSDVFYGNFLGPALRIRRDVTLPLHDSSHTPTVDRELRGSTGLEDDRIEGLLADLLRRNQIFDRQLGNARALISTRDTYRGYIEQLAVKGQKIGPGTPGFVVKGQQEANVVEYFNSYTDSSGAPTYGADHNVLLGREHPDAHPQYLAHNGGTVTGDISVDEGVSIDGIDLSEHRHDGADGSKRIRASDLIPGTLVTGIVDKDEEVCAPQALHLINSTSFVGSEGVRLVNSQIAWTTCDTGLTFEVQMVPVGSPPEPEFEPEPYNVTTIVDLDVYYYLNFIAWVSGDIYYITLATETALYDYNWTTGEMTHIAGHQYDGDYIDGESFALARFSEIRDLAHDFTLGVTYVADGTCIRMTGGSNEHGHNLPMDVITIYEGSYPVMAIESQVQNSINTLHIVEELSNGFHRVVRLDGDKDTGNLIETAIAGEEFITPGGESATVISPLEGAYRIRDIAAAPNGLLYLLTEDDKLVIYEPESEEVYEVQLEEKDQIVPLRVVSDVSSDAFIMYGEVEIDIPPLPN